MPRNEVPLDKQLLHLDLTKGVDERTRPECGDTVTLLTRLENLQTDQGAWVKRPGHTVLGGIAVDDAGTSLAVTRLMRAAKGLVGVGPCGLSESVRTAFYAYQEGREEFRQAGTLPEFVVDRTDIACSSAGSVNPEVISVATSTRYHAIIADSQRGRLTLTIYEKESGTVAASYLLSETNIGAVHARIMFVGDRYLHIGYTVSTAGLCGVVIDTDGVIPRSNTELGDLIALTGDILSPDAGPVATLPDYAAHTDRSIWLYNNSAGTSNLVSMGNDSQGIDNVATVLSTSIANSGTKLWRIDGTNLQAVSPTNLATVLVVAGAHGLVSVGPIAATSTNLVYCVSHSGSKTLGSGTIYSLSVSMNTSFNATAMAPIHLILDGWERASAPFVTTGNRAYLHVVKIPGAAPEAVAPHAIVDITYNTKTEVLDSATSEHYKSGRLACSLEPHIGFGGTTFTYWTRYFSHDAGVTVCPVVPIIATARTFGYCFLSLKDSFHSKTESASVGGMTYLSGGAHSTYDGERVYESGFIDQPIVNSAAGSATGLTGALKYIAVYKRVDATGSVTWSRCSSVSSFTPANTKINLTITPPNVTNSDQSLCYSGALAEPFAVAGVELYRTTVGGTQYYLCSSSFRSATTYTGLATQALTVAASGFYTGVDAMTDAVLATQPLLFRQPGSQNSAIDRYPPPPSNLLCQHKDRLFTSDAHGVRVYYSSFLVDGEAAWYNPQFSFLVHGGTGKITAISSMDGRLFVFKKDGIWVVDGDGPGEAGVTGNEFSPPQKLATEYGCIDNRSVCVTPDGIVYRSKRGVEIITRSLQVKWIGDRVQNTVNANPYTCWTVLDNEGRVHMQVAESEPTVPTVTGLSGAELVYDVPSNVWSIHYSTGSNAEYGEATQDACMVDLLGLGEVMVVADPALGVRYKDNDSKTDDGEYVPTVVETGWIRPGQQSRQRFSRALLLAKRQDYHKFTISSAYDYLDNYGQSFVYEPTVIEDGLIEELELQMNKPHSLAVRLLIEESAATDQDEYPFTTGFGADILGITFEIAPKMGAPSLPPAKKGYLLSNVTFNLETEDEVDDIATEGDDDLITEVS